MASSVFIITRFLSPNSYSVNDANRRKLVSEPSLNRHKIRREHRDIRSKIFTRNETNLNATPFHFSPKPVSSPIFHKQFAPVKIPTLKFPPEPKFRRASIAPQFFY